MLRRQLNSIANATAVVLAPMATLDAQATKWAFANGLEWKFDDRGDEAHLEGDERD